MFNVLANNRPQVYTKYIRYLRTWMPSCKEEGKTPTPIFLYTTSAYFKSVVQIEKVHVLKKITRFLKNNKNMGVEENPHTYLWSLPEALHQCML